MLCNWAKHNTVDSVVSLNPGWVIPVLLGDLSHISSSNSSLKQSRPQGGKQHPGRTIHGIRGGSNKSLCSEDGHELTFLLLSILHQEHIPQKNSLLYFLLLLLLLNRPQNGHLPACTPEPVQRDFSISAISLAAKTLVTAGRKQLMLDTYSRFPTQILVWKSFFLLLFDLHHCTVSRKAYCREPGTLHQSFATLHSSWLQ